MESELRLETMIYIIPTILHTVGMYILFKIRNTRIPNRSQYLCLCNMGFVEFLTSVIFLSSPVPIKPEIRLHLDIFKDGVLLNWFLLIMIILTFDRFMEVYLNIKYNLLWSVRKTKVCLFLAPLLALSITISVYVLSHRNLGTLFKLYIGLYVWSTLNSTTLTVIVVTYAYILYKIKSYPSSGRSTRVDSESSRREMCLDTKNNFIKKMKRKIYAPTFLIATFLLFCFVPDNIYFYYQLRGIKPSDRIVNYIIISHAFEFTTDAVIYIIASKMSREFVRRSTKRASDRKMTENVIVNLSDNKENH